MGSQFTHIQQNAVSRCFPVCLHLKQIHVFAVGVSVCRGGYVGTGKPGAGGVTEPWKPAGGVSSCPLRPCRGDPRSKCPVLVSRVLRAYVPWTWVGSMTLGPQGGEQSRAGPWCQGSLGVEARWQPVGQERLSLPLMQACVSAPPAAGASGIFHPQPLLHHVPVCSGVAHPGAEHPSTFLSLLAVSLLGTALGFFPSAWAAGPAETVSSKQTSCPEPLLPPFPAFRRPVLPATAG